MIVSLPLWEVNFYTKDMKKNIAAPVADKKPFELVSKHGHIRIDNYYWLNDRENPEVIDYLNAENQYLETMMGHTKDFQEQLFQEMKGRIKEDDASVPYRLDDYFYYAKYVKGGEYPIYCRKYKSLEAEEEILVDGNELGKDKSFLNFFISVSHDHQLMSIIMDTQGRNFYSVMIKDLSSGEYLPDRVENIRSSTAWTSDNKSFYYAVPDPQTLRNHQIKRHILGTYAIDDEVVYEEKDATLNCGIGMTKSKKYIIISSGRTDASFAHYIDAEMPHVPKLVAPLKDNVQYDVDHAVGNEFLIYTNHEAVNYKLVSASIGDSDPKNWKDIIPQRADVFLERVEHFKDFMAVEEKKNALPKIRIIKRADSSEHEIEFGEPAFSASISINPEFDTKLLRYGYTSMTTPRSVIDYHMENRSKEVKKEQAVLGDFDKENYKTERILVPARDGKKIPMSIVYRKDTFKKDGSMPGWIYSYGSYGYDTDPGFSSSRLSLLDRGFVYAIAHIRGGQEMGETGMKMGK